MPTLKIFRKECAFSSDDLVPVSAVAVLIRILMLLATLGITVYIGAKLDQCHPRTLGFLVAFLFGTILVNLLLLTMDCNLLAVSAKGSIMGVRSREPIAHVFIALQLILTIGEVGVSVLGAISAWHPTVANNLDCVESNVQATLAGFTITMWILLVAKLVYFAILFDPFLCFSWNPASYVDDSDDEEEVPKYESVVIHKRSWKRLCTKKTAVKVDKTKKTLYNTKTAKLWGRTLSRFARICCGCRKRQEENSVLDSIAKDMAIIFCEKTSGLALSDIAAALVLAKREQREKFKLYQHSIKVLTIGQMKEGAQLVEFERGQAHVERYTPEKHEPKRLDLQHLGQGDVKRLNDAIYYFRYSMGVYGWPMYCFKKPCTGGCRLMCKMGDLCACRSGDYQFEQPKNDTCGCNTAALAISAQLSKHSIVHISNDNELFKAPYAVLLDSKMRSVIISIRGTMSLKDVLTDLSISLKEIRMKEAPFNRLRTQVHLGLYETAENIINNLLKLNILTRCFDQHPDYSITIVGHSLGAGVASVLALLFKIDERLKVFASKGLQCFAYSPPGCVFSYPLAEYSKKFVTTIVLNSDAVPCLNWRSLLFLKHMMWKHLTLCQKPKYAVLYKGFIPRVQCLPNPGSEETDFGEQETNQPDIDPFIQNMFTKPKCLDYLGKFRQKPLVIQHVSQIVTAKMLGGRWKERAMTHGHIKEEDETVEGDDVVIEQQNLPSEQEESTEDLDTSIVADTLITATHNGNVAEENTDSAPMKETEPLHHQRSSLDDVKEHLHLTRQLSKGFTNAATDVSPIPAFIPGMVYHIETRRHPTCLPFVKKYSCNVTMKANEDFGVIRLDKTTLKCHLPNEVDAALKLLKSEMNSETSGNEYYDLGIDYEETFL